MIGRSPMTISASDKRPQDSWMQCEWLDEPLLEFASGGKHVSPRSGIARYGPGSYQTARHPDVVRIAFIGPGDAIEQAEKWLSSIADGVRGTDKTPEFPGWQPDRGFFSRLDFSPTWNEVLSQNELRAALGHDRKKAKFDAIRDLLDDKLRLIAQRDRRPDVVVIPLPDDLVRAVGSWLSPAKGIDSFRDLRRATKGAAMRWGLPTQFLRASTVEGRDSTPMSRIAWNICTGLYTKAGGFPWSPLGLTPDTCYVGVGFFRPLDAGARMQTSLAQAFDEHGEGLVLRGPDFEWDDVRMGTKSPHLSGEQAELLMTTALDRYQQVMKRTPARVVVHKTSRYWPEESEGFRAGAERVSRRLDMLALGRQSRVRLLPLSKYPPLRGTRFTIGDLDFLYTTGFVPALNEFHGMHVPAPLEVADHVGQDSGREHLLREVLSLTKLNWNSSQLGGSLPITIRFSQLVGQILRETPDDVDPLPQFKFYM